MDKNIDERFEEIERKIEKEKISRRTIENTLLFLIGLSYIPIAVALLSISSKFSELALAIGLTLYGSAVFFFAVDGVKAVKKLLHFNPKFGTLFIAVTGIWVISSVLNIIYNLLWLSLFIRIIGIVSISFAVILLIETILYSKKCNTVPHK